MRKGTCFILVILMCCLLAVPALAASEGPVITQQPQSPNYPNYSVAIYTVKAEGTNLKATWYIEWMDKTYNASKIGGAMQAWEAYAGESYGARKLDDNTFAFIFEGIERDLDGAYIWCVIEDGHYDVTSQKVRISVGNPNSPPEIISVPSEITVEQGSYAEIRCVARAPEGTQLSFLWYESDTGKMEDIRAVNRGTETTDYLICDTSNLGVRNYICFINTSDGGFANTSFVTVTVIPKTQSVPEPEILTESLPKAEVGTKYSFQLQCSDPEANFQTYYNPGQDNDLDKTGLELSSDGWLTGTPTAAGKFTFCVCAAGEGGEDYRVYTLTVVEAPPPETTAPVVATPEPTEPSENVPKPTEPSEETSKPTEPSEEPTEPTVNAPETTEPSVKIPNTEPSTPATSNPSIPDADKPQTPEKESGELPWWALALIGAASAGVGVGTAIILIKKKS